MVHPDSPPSAGRDPVELFLVCASDRENAAAWSEFLERYACRIKHFIRGTLLRRVGPVPDPGATLVRGGPQESDLLQNTILRLVENDCAVMRRFSGTTEGELLAYLAVISRSVVMDAMRRHRILRRTSDARQRSVRQYSLNSPGAREVADRSDPEREVLGRELAYLTHRTIKRLSGPAFSRDRLVMELYFSHGLSFRQIAECRGINLTKGGVEKLIHRLVEKVRILASTGKFEGRCDEQR